MSSILNKLLEPDTNHRIILISRFKGTTNFSPYGLLSYGSEPHHYLCRAQRNKMHSVKGMIIFQTYAAVKRQKNENNTHTYQSHE